MALYTLDSRAFDINNKLQRREGSGSTGRFGFGFGFIKIITSQLYS
jgi:hypothetical protein